MQCFSFLPSYTRIEFLTLSRFGMSDSEHSSLSNMLLQADSHNKCAKRKYRGWIQLTYQASLLQEAA